MSNCKISSKKKGLLVVISAPSGCGKTTVVKELLKKKTLGYSISATTREKRKGERQGRDYFFLTEHAFKSDVKKNRFLEWAKVFDNYYGTPKKYVDLLRSKGKDVLLDIDVQGAEQLLQKANDAVFIFMLPPNLPELKRRLHKRRSDSLSAINKRFSQAKKEIKCASRYDYVVVNRKVNETTATIEMIIKSEKHTLKRNKEVLHALHTT